MLELQLLEQLKEVFAKLEHPVVLRVDRSSHDSQTELDEMLLDLSKASPQIQLEQSSVVALAPSFELWSEGVFSGIRFRAVPGGHEFSSLILSILYCDGKGKIPDGGVRERIRRLKGPIRLKTFMSLSCENCPEVVQALNLMASLHPDFENETIDGALAQDEVESLGLQGVPAVVAGGKLIHSGKIQLLDLLAKLEAHFGATNKQVDSSAPAGAPAGDLGKFDVVVVGGGPAGASAAIYSARKGLKTALLAERFGGQLQETKGIENMISQSYTEGVRLSAQLADHLQRYPVHIFEHRRVKQIEERQASGLRRLALESGEALEANSVIIATGAKWRELGIPGEKEHVGFGVAFCAHCDGPFYKGKRVAVVGGGNSGVEAAIDLAAIATHVTLLEYGRELKADTVLVEKLSSLPNVQVLLQAKSTEVVGDGKKVSALVYEDLATQEAHRIQVDGVFVQIGLLPNSQFVKDVVETTRTGEIVVDPKGRTSASGIYAAGDVTTVPFKQIVIAMGEGAKAALTAFEDRIHSK